MPSDSGPQPMARIAAIVVGVYALIFVALALDVAIRIMALRSGFDRVSDAFQLAGGEIVRAVVGFVIIVIGVRLAQDRLRPAARRFAFFLLFLDVWYLKSFSGNFPGFAQERFANALLQIGVPSRLLQLVFGEPIWALWLALAALILFSLEFPGPVSSAAIRAGGREDRRGAMRSVALAGADVGATFRRAVSGMIETNLLRPRVVWPTAAVVGLFVALDSPGSIVAFAGWILFGACSGIAITALRAGREAATASDLEVLLWLRRGVLVAAFAGLVFAALSGLDSLDGLAYLVFVAAPATVAVCAALAAHNLSYVSSSDAGPGQT